MKRYFILIPVLFSFNLLLGQIGFGTVSGFDLYQRYRNPVDEIAYPASGNAFLNFIYGPKIWIGGPKFSVSAEGQVNLGLTSLAVKDFKGLGAVSFPVMAKFNFNGLSGFHSGFKSGFSIGGGMQWTKTELYYLSGKYKDRGVSRDFFDVYFVQVDLGFGSFGTDSAFYIRYGTNPDNKANVLNIGVVISKNKSFKKKIKSKMAPVTTN